MFCVSTGQKETTFDINNALSLDVMSRLIVNLITIVSRRNINDLFNKVQLL